MHSVRLVRTSCSATITRMANYQETILTLSRDGAYLTCVEKGIITELFPTARYITSTACSALGGQMSLKCCVPVQMMLLFVITADASLVTGMAYIELTLRTYDTIWRLF